jgi:hypothetical protein
LNWECLLRAVKAISRSQLNDGYLRNPAGVDVKRT